MKTSKPKPQRPRKPVAKRAVRGWSREKIAELSIHKRETGHINDAYRRGWALRAYDKFKRF